VQKYYQFCGLYLLYVLGVHIVPGPWQKWTSHGRALDPWTLTHLMWGYLGKYYGIPLPILLALSLGNEGVEAYLRYIKFLGIWGDPETPKNIAMDLSATSLGWLLKNGILDK